MKNFFLNELLSDSEKENKTKNSFENIGNIKEQFGFKQVGSIANYIEPINSSNPIEIVLEKFLENEDLQAIPIEEDDQIVGLIERRSVSSLLSKKIGLFSNKKIINYVKTIPFLLQLMQMICNFFLLCIITAAFTVWLLLKIL